MISDLFVLKISIWNKKVIIDDSDERFLEKDFINSFDKKYIEMK